MLEVKLDGTDRTPLFEQVAGEIRRAIADGEAGPGDRLPPARDLAAVLGVNANTVLRALRILREFRQGRGVSVAGGARQRSTVSSKARELTQIARRQGYGKDELIKLIAGIY
jgi:GntR family transcriptional regulator